ncbi:MAG TPA: TlpA disulfide reductase family protein [Azospira sp.]|nr:TlpA disulfide reductase family protein [Azospira sp.]
MALAVLTFLGKRQAGPAVELKLLGGPGLTLESLKGRVVVVHFWATTCGDCDATLAELAQQHRRYQARGLETLAVAMAYDQPRQVASYAYANNLPFKVVQDDGTVARGFGLAGANPPLTFLLDRQGRVAQRLPGKPDPGRLRAVVEKLLAESP